MQSSSQSGDLMTDLTAMGFWLPCGRANFIRHREDPALCRKDTFDLVKIVDEDLARRGNQPEPEDLHASVYRRLLIVLRDKEYSRVFGITPDNAESFNEEDVDPSAVMLTTEKLEDVDWPKNDDPLWPESIPQDKRDVVEGAKRSLQAVALIVNARGFYLWIAVHPGLSGEAQQAAVQVALKRHIIRLVGDGYYSHIKDRETATALGLPEYINGIPTTLQRYRDDHFGFLPFFQLNSILEGLYSASFDPRVFFYHEHERLTEIKEEYSIGRFIEQIVVATVIGSDKQKDLIDGILNSSTLPPASSELKPEPADEAAANQQPTSAPPKYEPEGLPQEGLQTLILELARGELPDDPRTIQGKVRQLRRSCLNKLVRRDLLRQFLRRVSVISLQEMKWRIERTRRALLTEVLEITHRQEPLEQAEAPDKKEDNIAGVNEAQLRGYIMLFAAKYPLVQNVHRFLHDAYGSIGIEDVQEKRVKDVIFGEALQAFLAGWDALIHGIDDNIRGLERAIEQARMDRMVYEEQQIRAVQETLGEIDRIRERSDASLSPTSNLAVNILASLIAVVAVAIAFFTTAQRFGDEITSLSSSFPRWADALIAVGGVLISVIALLILNSLLQDFIGLILWLYFQLRKWSSGQSKRQNERLYYEMDIHINTPINQKKAESLFEANFLSRSWSSRRMLIDRDLREKWLFGLFAPLCISHSRLERKSYRVERANENEAAHKIYIETTIQWWRRWSVWRLFFRDMEIFLVYEVLFHKPADQESYALQDLRIISTYDWTLHAKDISVLKAAVEQQFIKPLLSQKDAEKWKSDDALKHHWQTCSGRHCGRQAGHQGRVTDQHSFGEPDLSCHSISSPSLHVNARGERLSERSLHCHLADPH
jgi:hypothetical protein